MVHGLPLYDVSSRKPSCRLYKDDINHKTDRLDGSLQYVLTTASNRAESMIRGEVLVPG